MAKYEAVTELSLPSGRVVAPGEQVDHKALGGDVASLLQAGAIVEPGSSYPAQTPQPFVEIDRHPHEEEVDVVAEEPASSNESSAPDTDTTSGGDS